MNSWLIILLEELDGEVVFVFNELVLPIKYTIKGNLRG